MTKEERDYLGKLATMGCYCCRTEGNESPALIHHIREGMGMGQRASHIGGLSLYAMPTISRENTER